MRKIERTNLHPWANYNIKNDGFIFRLFHELCSFSRNRTTSYEINQASEKVKEIINTFILLDRVSIHFDKALD